MHAYVDALETLYRSHANPVDAVPMKAYMRNQFEYLGIKTPQGRALLREYIAEYGLPELDELPSVLLALWALPEREYQYAALGLLGQFEGSLPPDFIDTIEVLLTTKSWWDTVDSLATHTVGIHFRRYPQVRERALGRWRQSDHIWLRRTCILFQNKYKTETDFDLLKAIICENLGSKEFFINKAIGWALREYTRVDPDGVRAFVAETPLASLSAREALKWLNRQANKHA
jgi:3-methyladenine DNA glycosylase AlkD